MSVPLGSKGANLIVTMLPLMWTVCPPMKGITPGSPNPKESQPVTSPPHALEEYTACGAQKFHALVAIRHVAPVEIDPRIGREQFFKALATKTINPCVRIYII